MRKILELKFMFNASDAFLLEGHLKTATLLK